MYRHPSNGRSWIAKEVSNVVAHSCRHHISTLLLHALMHCPLRFIVFVSKYCVASDVSKLISSVFHSQVFLSGFVHADPHPANVLLRKHPNKPGKPQLVLVDHGLYKEIDDDFRILYAHLYKSLLMADLPKIKCTCEKLGITKMVRTSYVYKNSGIHYESYTFHHLLGANVGLQNRLTLHSFSILFFQLC
jgi:hypothetical protein